MAYYKLQVYHRCLYFTPSLLLIWRHVPPRCLSQGNNKLGVMRGCKISKTGYDPQYFLHLPTALKWNALKKNPGLFLQLGTWSCFLKRRKAGQPPAFQESASRKVVFPGEKFWFWPKHAEAIRYICVFMHSRRLTDRLSLACTIWHVALWACHDNSSSIQQLCCDTHMPISKVFFLSLLNF